MFSRGLVLDLEISGFDSVDVASLFKLYFRDLPGHILGTKSVLIALRDLAKDIEDTKERVRWIQHCLGSLPAVNMNILRYLIRHMQVIIAKDSLKMSRETFADAFSTTLDIPTIVIVDMVNHFSDIFEHEQLESANDSSSDESTSDSGGGSKKHREMGNGNSMEEQL
ncbi:hypothetical protein SARC_04835 [Sphaeroforma arctica JP610]|uniref:Rho-GAP domain-containing protein n=1 Tax=Sphaeroforma arctica JP610 TaxID=667725 RepID=A0A0L0G168_9EUKA|nr:hypothetical protein SARC_04835 [Sphaeroforma arctica JP610]KNC82892.1 hypothetical protein SARC_04835 [Sphaeroforma arctica JP610]|eukprot:XP_014156794.1 hypothetical protein SARC_04835 [Sphaeroforma arctica JP610]